MSDPAAGHPDPIGPTDGGVEIPVGRWHAVWAPLAAALLWVVLSLRTPTDTFHFAPIVVAVVWPIVARVGRGARFERWDALVVSGAGPALAILVGVALAATGNLEGPTLWGGGDAVFGALFEVVLFALAGGLFGYRVVSRPRAGLLF